MMRHPSHTTFCRVCGGYRVCFIIPLWKIVRRASYLIILLWFIIILPYESQLSWDTSCSKMNRKHEPANHGFGTIKVAVVCIRQDWSEFGDCSVVVQSKCCWAHANQVSHGDGHFCLNKKKMDSHQKPLTLLWIYTYERRETVGYLVVGWNLIGSKYSTIALCQDLVLFCLIFYQLRVHDICLQYLDYRCQKLGISHHELLILI